MVGVEAGGGVRAPTTDNTTKNAANELLCWCANAAHKQRSAQGTRQEQGRASNTHYLLTYPDFKNSGGQRHADTAEHRGRAWMMMVLAKWVVTPKRDVKWDRDQG